MDNNDDLLLILSTCPDAESAGRIARMLVEEYLAACVTKMPGVASVYRWHDGLREDSEVVLLIKTRRKCFDPLRARLVELHPYEVPEVIALGIADGHAPYLAWLRDQTRG